MRYQFSHFGPLPFKAAGKPPVKGGRWSVRREWSSRPWRSWSRGTARNFSRRFETHAEAIEHATMVAQAFADPTPERVEAMIRRVYPTAHDDTVRRNVERYAKFPKPQRRRRA